MTFVKDLEQKIKKGPKKKIVLPESLDERIIKAAAEITAQDLAEIVFVGDQKKISKEADKLKADISKVEIFDPAAAEDIGTMADYYFERRKHKPQMTREKALRIVQEQPVYTGAALVGLDKADGMVAGCINATTKLIKAGIFCVGLEEGVQLVSSYFIMIQPDSSFGEEGLYFFADCGVNPSPSAEQLADIAKCTADNFKKFIGKDARIALLSFSTKGSAEHDDVSKITSALSLAKVKYPDLMIDGELQLDTAIVPAIAARKAPDSKIAGKANVLIFPDLNSGNICYKAVQYLGKAEAYGPILQGLAKPINDLSRGADVEDIINVIKITALQAQ